MRRDKGLFLSCPDRNCARSVARPRAAWVEGALQLLSGWCWQPPVGVRGPQAAWGRGGSVEVEHTGWHARGGRWPWEPCVHFSGCVAHRIVWDWKQASSALVIQSDVARAACSACERSAQAWAKLDQRARGATLAAFGRPSPPSRILRKHWPWAGTAAAGKPNRAAMVSLIVRSAWAQTASVSSGGGGAEHVDDAGGREDATHR
jgi:hypothetical protein